MAPWPYVDRASEEGSRECRDGEMFHKRYEDGRP